MISEGARTRAMRHSIIAGGSGALFLTVCGNQSIFNVYLMNHLGASPLFAGALLGFMQLTGVLQLLSIFAFGMLKRRKPFWLAMHLVHRFAGIAVLASALVSAAPAEKGEAARLTALAMGFSWAAMNLSASGWLSWMADLIPEDRRGSFFLKRSAVFQAVLVVWFFLASMLLDLFPAESDWIAYTLIFGIGAVGGVIDILLHIAIPEPPAHESGMLPGFEAFIAPLKDANFLRFSLAVGLGQLALLFANPFQGPYVTSPRSIGAPNVWLGIMTVISQLTWVTMAPLWGFVMDRYGRKPAVELGCLVAIGLAGYAALTPSDYVYLLPLIALVTGFFGPAFWEGSSQLMLTLAPAERRVIYVAWYNAIVGLVSAAGPLGGGYIASALSGLNLGIGTFRLRGFHVGQLAGFFLMGVAMLVLRKVREGKERPAAYLATQFASAGVFRNYASVGALGRDSGDPRVARALRRIDREDGDLVLREVIARLDDPSPEVREEAARALGRIGSSEATEELLSRLSDPASAIHIEAARALGRIGDERAVPALARCLAGASPELRAACAEALGAIGGEAATKALSEALRGENDRAVLAMGTEAITRKLDLGASEGPAELLEAVEELFGRLVDARNPALERQYAIAIGNLLGKPAEFYRFITGESAARASHRRELFLSFRARVEAALRSFATRDGESDEQGPIFDALDAAIEAESADEALVAVLTLHHSLMSRIFGSLADDIDFPRAAGRFDLRLGAWAWIAREASRLVADPPPGFDERTRLLIALLGMYYLGSA